MKQEKERMIKGIKYEIVEDKVVLHTDPVVELPLELGKSAYSVAYGYLNRKESTRTRGVGGKHVVGNFTYEVGENNVLMITRKNGEIMTHTMTEEEAKYPRTAAIKVILSTLE